MKPILLLDVLGTLVHDPFYEEVPRFFGMTLDRLIAEKHPRSWIDFEHGRLEEAEYVRTFFQDARAIDGDGLKACMRDAFRWIEGMEELLSELHGHGLLMHALSNYPSWWTLIEQRLQLSRFLSWSFVSCRTGHRKPHPEAYLAATAALAVRPDECLFVDDRRENVIAAEKLGMPALWFRDAATLRGDLSARGVLP